MIQQIVSWDQSLFAFFNQTLTSPWMDGFMTWVSDFNSTWIFLAPFLTWLAWKKRLQVIAYILGAGLSVGLADLAAAKIIKPLVQRQRPEYVLPETRILNYHSSSFSFPSNHSSNCFAAATSLSYGFPNPIVRLILFFIAAVVGFSRIYLGLHFPIDVVGGAFLGVACAIIIHKFILKILNQNLFARLLGKSPNNKHGQQKQQLS